MPDNHIRVNLGFIAVATTLYFGHMVTAKSGTNTLSLAYKATKLCTDVEKHPELRQMDYDSCLHSVLEPMVWILLENNDLDLNKCKADEKEKSKKAWCTVFFGWWWKSILITNERLVEYIAAPAWNKPKMPKKEDELITTKQPPTQNRPQIPSVNEFVRHKMNEAKEEVYDSIIDLREKVEDKAKLHAERANQLAEDLGGRLADTGKYVAASMRDLRDNLKTTWQKPKTT